MTYQGDEKVIHRVGDNNKIEILTKDFNLE